MRLVKMNRFIVGAGVTLSLIAFAGVVSAAAGPPGTNTRRRSGRLFNAVQRGAEAGSEPLSPCQWDMRAIGATPTGSYAVNQGAGARVGVIDTGIDLTNGDIMPNVDLAASCVFLYADHADG